MNHIAAAGNKIDVRISAVFRQLFILSCTRRQRQTSKKKKSKTSIYKCKYRYYTSKFVFLKFENHNLSVTMKVKEGKISLVTSSLVDSTSNRIVLVSVFGGVTNLENSNER